MFTGIIEALGKIEQIEQEGSNFHYTIASPISSELKIDQSIAHNGVCLTVVGLSEGKHVVTAVEETMNRTNLGQWKTGHIVNLERCMKANARLDGHWVQGHVDGTALCTEVREAGGSWYFHFQYEPGEERLLVDKGSICINGTSLTVVEPEADTFSVAIIPYTFENTVFKTLKKGDLVNLEFDVLGKYIAKYLKLYLPK